MKVNVSVKTSDVRRLFKSGVKGKMYNQKDLVDMLYVILDRLERDYPNAMKPVYDGVSRRYQKFLSKQLASRRKEHQDDIDSLYGSKI